MVAARQARGMAVWVFVFFTCSYALLTTGHLDTPDGIVVFNVTRALAGGSLSFPSLERTVAMAGPAAPAGAGGEPRQYGKYGLGLSLAALPAYGVSRALLPLTLASERDLFLTPPVIEGIRNRRDGIAAERRDGRSFRGLSYDVSPAQFGQAFGALWASWTNAWVSAGTAALALLLLFEIGYTLHAATAAALLLGVASPLLHYSTAFFAEPLAGLLVLAALYFLARHARTGNARDLVFAGLAFGCVGLTKIALLSLVILAIPGRALLRRLALLGSGMVLPLALIAAYNMVRFGTPLETGYGEEANAWRTPFLEGFVGLVMSPGRGALLYCPAVVAGYAYLPRLWRRSREVALFAGLALPLLVALYARWWLWEGGWCWGPRFVLPGIVLALLPLAERFQDAGRRFFRRSVDLLLAASLVISASSLLVNFADFYMWLKKYTDAHPEAVTTRGYQDYYGLLRWEWDFAPIVAYWDFPRRNYLLITHALERPGLVLGIFVLAFIGAVWSAFQVIRRLRAAR